MPPSSQMMQLYNFVLTTAYLKPTQFIHRVRHVFQQKVLHRSVFYRSIFDKKATGDEPFSPINFPFVRSAFTNTADIEKGIFTFLNRSVELGDPISWQPESETRLWLYNLHYFDYLRDIARDYQVDPSAIQQNLASYALFRRLVDQWINSCPIAMQLAWDSYPISLRLNNWLRAYTLFLPALLLDPAFARRLRRSMYVQASFLEKHLEYQLLNNHLLENGRTLWLLGHFFQGIDADRWRKKGRDILWDGLNGHFLKDGGHDELSPMYHQIMLDMYQEVADVMTSHNETVPVLLAERLSGMRCWLSTVLHPDGDLSLFNDSALGIAGKPSDFTGDEPLNVDGFNALADSGYFVFRDSKKGHFLMFDCGVMGPDHRMAHGHCDALSFELSLGGKRIIVDSGVSDYYGDIEWRNFYRSTRAHNTVVVNNQEQSEIWDRFRVARRARPKDVTWSNTDTLSYVTAAHTGYERLTDSVKHQRWLCWIDRRFWVICDRVQGHESTPIESFLHFHPAVSIDAIPVAGEEYPSGRVTCGKSVLQVKAFGAHETQSYCGVTKPLQGWYSAEFGASVANTVWGFKQTVQQVLWTGYILWPEQSDFSLNTYKTDDGCELDIVASDQSYRLSITSRGVAVDSNRTSNDD